MYVDIAKTEGRRRCCDSSERDAGAAERNSQIRMLLTRNPGRARPYTAYTRNQLTGMEIQLLTLQIAI